MDLKVKNFRPFHKGALRGYLDIDVESLGWTLKGCSLFTWEDRTWINPPSRPYKDENGETKYASIIGMEQDAFKEFGEACLKAYEDFINPPKENTETDLLEIPF